MRRFARRSNMVRPTRNSAALTLIVAAVFALSACSVDGGAEADEPLEDLDASETENAQIVNGEIESAPAEVKNAGALQPEDLEPIEMAETAWAANDTAGEIYTTFIDSDGTYRDFRAGERYQIGSWDMPGMNRICYRPDNAPVDVIDSDVGRTCWTVRPPGRDGVMIAVDASGREVTVRKVKYVPPLDPPPEE